MTLLTGASPVLAGAWPGAAPAYPSLNREVLQQLKARGEIRAASLTFAYRQPDGRFHAYAVSYLDLLGDTVCFHGPRNSGGREKMSIDELLAKPQLRLASA